MPMPVPQNTQRQDTREPTRDNRYVRQHIVDPSEKYALDPAEKTRGMDYVWAALRVRGAPLIDRYNEFRAGGWEPCRAEDHPGHSGYKPDANWSHHDKFLADQGFIRKVGPDDPVIKGDMILMTRPENLSKESRGEDRARADQQVEDHLSRLRQVSRRAIGDKTRVSRSVSRSANPPSDFADDNSDLGDI